MHQRGSLVRGCTCANASKVWRSDANGYLKGHVGILSLCLLVPSKNIVTS